LIPEDLKPGTYVSFVEVETPDHLIGTSSDVFEVEAKYEERFSRQFIYYALGLAIVAVLIIIITFSVGLFRKLKKQQLVTEFKVKRPQEKIQKLEKELSALESAYKSKFISEESYRKDKERIEKYLQKLKGGKRMTAEDIVK